MITMPNLVWGSNSTTKLGSYEYGTDTITMSRILADDEECLDYVMYHEMLHKKVKFYTKNNKSYSHTSEFRRKEKEFENFEAVDKRLEMLVRKNKWKGKKGTVRGRKKKRKWSFLDYF